MAEATPSENKRCIYFFLYDCSKVQEEGDLTRDGICYFYPEDTPLEQQELLCGQLAGVSRCVSELSCSPVRLLRLRRNKYAVRMRDHYLWALSCVCETPDVSVCEFLDQLIDLYSFYNGSVRLSYQCVFLLQLQGRGELALRWARYLSHLQGGTTPLHSVFTCLRTIDSTHIDPLLLLKAALILQACQRCPLVLAGCILYRGRVVSTQMPPELTMKVMVHETETYSQDHKTCVNGIISRGSTSSSVSSSSSSSSLSSSSSSSSPNTVTTTVFLTPADLHSLRCPPVDNSCRCHCSPQPSSHPRKAPLLSRTLSDTLTDDLDLVKHGPNYTNPLSYQTLPSSSRSSLSDEPFFSPSRSLLGTPSHPTSLRSQSERGTPDPRDHTLSNGTLPNFGESGSEIPVQQEGEGSPKKQEEEEVSLETNQSESSTLNQSEVGKIGTLPNGHSSKPDGTNPSGRRDDKQDEGAEKPESYDASERLQGGSEQEEEGGRRGGVSRGSGRRVEVAVKSGLWWEGPTDTNLEPMLLYQHRVRGLVLTLLVEPEFNADTKAKEEVYHSSLSSLNGLEAHLRTAPAGTPGPQGPYTFAHYDCIQNTLTTSVCSHSAGSQDRAFVKAAALMHSHFSSSDTLQEAIVRNASCAVYATRTAVQETFFLQQGAGSRNSGIPNAQDSAFTLPSKARHRLLKHGVNLL